MAGYLPDGCTQDALDRYYGYDQPDEEPEINSCAYPGCHEPPVASCDCACPNRFCEDHGTPSRDVEYSGYAPQAHPAACWQHGGYNADGE